jgi:lipopolysaccharide transport system ATP-binding protein
MAIINFQDVSLDLPIYNVTSRSFRRRVLEVATGGRLISDQQRVLVKALDQLTLSIQDGERVGVIGHNGSGKTTLLRLINGIYPPTSGHRHVSGRVGSLIDISLGTDPEATGRENIYLRGSLIGIDRDTLDENISEIIDFSELGDFIDLPLRTYSSGMCMRLAFSISTTIKADILLMDEWLTVGDEQFQSKAEGRINSLLKDSNILVLASHSRELIKKTCNRVIWLEHGRVKLDGSVDSVIPKYFK